MRSINHGNFQQEAKKMRNDVMKTGVKFGAIAIVLNLAFLGLAIAVVCGVLSAFGVI